MKALIYDPAQELSVKIEDEKIDRKVRQETNPMAMRKKALEQYKKNQEKSENEDTEALKKLKSLNNVGRRFFHFSQKYSKTIQQKANLYRRLKSSSENIKQIVECINLGKKINTHSWKYPRLAHEKLILKMAWHTNKYKDDNERFVVEKKNLLLILNDFRRKLLTSKVRELKKELIKANIDIELFEPHERVFVKTNRNKKILKIEKIIDKPRKKYVSWNPEAINNIG